MISVLINDPGSFWVTGASEIREILSAMKIFTDALVILGYHSQDVYVGGGVHELDTGYESFGKNYADFEEMRKNLPADFVEEESQLDGSWLNTLNFESIYVGLEKDGERGFLRYSRGELSLSCFDEAAVYEKCRETLQPYLYEK